MPNIMMQCGCRANSTCDGKPACAIHAGDPRSLLVAPTPNLEGRQAKCTYGDHGLVPSSLGLAFFEYRGPGSRDATDTCGNCHYFQVAHERPVDKRSGGVCSNFVPQGPQEFDRYYCGCHGWD